MELLLNQLQASDKTVRSQAALSLGKLGAADSVQELVEQLCREADLFVQEDITWALARLGEASLHPLLAKLTDASPHVRHVTVHTLGKLGLANALPHLLTCLADSEARIRVKTCFVLGQLKDSRAVPALIRMLDDANGDVQASASDALLQFGAVAQADLVAALDHPSEHLRETVVYLLGELKAAETLIPLTQALGDEAWQVRFATVEALAKFPKPVSQRYLCAHQETETNPRVLAILKRFL